MSKTRRESRELAFVILFDKSFNEEMPLEEIINYAVEEELITEDEFAIRLATLATENREEIDTMIEDKLTKWTISRIPKVSLAVLRLAIAEMLYIEDVPVGVSINEAVEISKKFSLQEDSSFVNGVLGNIAKTIKK